MKDNKSKRPKYVTTEYLEYLDELRKSGETNMYGASLFLVGEFGLGEKVAIDILSYWMKTFGEADR